MIEQEEVGRGTDGEDLSAFSDDSLDLRIGYCILLAFTGTTKVRAKAAACFSHCNDLQN